MILNVLLKDTQYSETPPVVFSFLPLCSYFYKILHSEQACEVSTMQSLSSENVGRSVVNATGIIRNQEVGMVVIENLIPSWTHIPFPAKMPRWLVDLMAMVVESEVAIAPDQVDDGAQASSEGSSWMFANWISRNHPFVCKNLDNTVWGLVIQRNIQCRSWYWFAKSTWFNSTGQYYFDLWKKKSDWYFVWPTSFKVVELYETGVGWSSFSKEPSRNS